MKLQQIEQTYVGNKGVHVFLLSSDPLTLLSSSSSMDDTRHLTEHEKLSPWPPINLELNPVDHEEHENRQILDVLWI